MDDTFFRNSMTALKGKCLLTSFIIALHDSATFDVRCPNRFAGKCEFAHRSTGMSRMYEPPQVSPTQSNGGTYRTVSCCMLKPPANEFRDFDFVLHEVLDDVSNAVTRKRVWNGLLDGANKTLFTISHRDNFSLLERLTPREECEGPMPILAVFNWCVRHCNGDNLSVPIYGRGEQQHATTRRFDMHPSSKG